MFRGLAFSAYYPAVALCICFDLLQEEASLKEKASSEEEASSSLHILVT